MPQEISLKIYKLAELDESHRGYALAQLVNDTATKIRDSVDRDGEIEGVEEVLHTMIKATFDGYFIGTGALVPAETIAFLRRGVK